MAWSKLSEHAGRTPPNYFAETRDTDVGWMRLHQNTAVRSADQLSGRSPFADANYRRHCMGGLRCRSLFGNSTNVSLRCAKYFGVGTWWRMRSHCRTGDLADLICSPRRKRLKKSRRAKRHHSPSWRIVWRGLPLANRTSTPGLLSIRIWPVSRRAHETTSWREGAFHGLPIGIKDIFDTFDMPTAYGSPIYKGFRPAIDTAVVGLLRRAGLVILGKCATTEFASPVPIGVKNPHDFGRSPGVSSSGSAAAVADYMVPLAVGSQTGGSTILPAAFCGVFGFKASLTGIDRGGIWHLRPGLDTMGLFARDLLDIASLQAIVTGFRQAASPPTCKCPCRSLPNAELASGSS